MVSDIAGEQVVAEFEAVETVVVVGAVGTVGAVVTVGVALWVHQAVFEMAAVLFDFRDMDWADDLLFVVAVLAPVVAMEMHLEVLVHLGLVDLEGHHFHWGASFVDFAVDHQAWDLTHQDPLINFHDYP